MPAVIWFISFSYLPLAGLVIAFQKYNPAQGILKSEFIGLKNFRFFFGSKSFFTVTFNTLFLNTLFILFTMLFSILVALAISEISGKWFKKVSQSVVILPHFISWTVVALLLEAFLTTEGGMVNQLLESMGMQRIPFYQDSSVWPVAGFGSIVYLATITGLDQEMFEAARVDGATRFQCIWYLTLPLLKTTAVLLFIMNVGKIFNGDFGMIYAIIGNNSLLYPTTDVIDTYVYRQLMEANNMGMSSAVSLYQSVMGLLMVMATNYIVKKMEPDSALF